MNEIERRELLRWAGIHIRSAFQGGYERTAQHVNDALHNITLVLADLNGEIDNVTETAVDRLTRELGEVQDELISARTAAKIENNLRLEAVAELADLRALELNHDAANVRLKLERDAFFNLSKQWEERSEKFEAELAELIEAHVCDPMIAKSNGILRCKLCDAARKGE